MNRLTGFDNTIFMIKKDLIVKRFIKLLSWLLVGSFLFLTATDMYIKNYGDISGNLPSESFIRETEAVGYIYKKEEDSVRLMTYNLLSDSLGFAGTDASERAGGVCKILESLSPDIIGFQEMSRKWFVAVKSNTDYKFIDFFRTTLFGTMTTLAFDSKRVDLLFSGEKTFSVGGDSRLRRMVWGVFSNKKDGKIFGVVNIHFDLSKKNQFSSFDDSLQMSQALETTRFVKEVIDTLKCPVFILGDFNVKQSTVEKISPVYEILDSVFYNAKKFAQSVSVGSSPQSVTSKNDHVFYFGNVSIERYCVLSNESYETLSDHYPIFVDVNLKK